MTVRRTALLIAAAFLAAAILLADVRPLWLDEVLQLIDTNQPSTTELIRRLPRHAGSSPLGYMVQQASLKVTGYSVRCARLPEALFSAGAVFLIVLLGAQLGLRRPWVAGLVLAAFPLVLRHATEGRMYAQALFYSVLATLLYVHLARKPAWPIAGAYFLALTAAAYAQPYALSVGAAHLLWSLARRDRKTALIGAAAWMLALAAFAPWYLWAKARWVSDIETGKLYFSASAKTPLMLFREIAGFGYWGSGLLVLVCALAIARRRLARPVQSLLIFLIAVPIAAGLAVDAGFDYFIAARQFLWVLPAVALLAAAEIEHRTRAGLVLAALLALVSIRQNVRFFTAPHENWEKAAHAIAGETRGGGCLVVVPPSLAQLYEYFEPSLQTGRCEGQRVILATSPYAKPEQRRAAVAALLASGFTQDSEIVAGKSVITDFRRRP